MTIKQQLNKSREEFDKEFLKPMLKMDKRFRKLGGNPKGIEVIEFIGDWHTSEQIKLLEAVKNWAAEKKLKNKDGQEMLDNNVVIRHNRLLEDLTTELDKIIKAEK